MATDDLAPLLAQVEALLRRHDCHDEAGQARFAQELWSRDPLAGRAELNGDAWWHGRNGIAAVDLAIAGGFTRAAREDAQTLREHLVALRDHLDAHGLDNEEAALQVRQFRKWTASHM